MDHRGDCLGGSYCRIRLVVQHESGLYSGRAEYGRYDNSRYLDAGSYTGSERRRDVLVTLPRRKEKSDAYASDFFMKENREKTWRRIFFRVH
jgi:hypothetical protein